MSTENQPLNNQPPEQEDDFDSAFDEFAGGRGADTRDTDRDFAGKDDEPQDEDAQGETGNDPEPGEDQEEGEDTGQPKDDIAERLARLETLEAENQRLKHSEASQRGRLGAYQRQINELQRQYQQRQSGASATPQSKNPDGQDAKGVNDQQKQDMAESMGLEDWESFKADFPDMARAFEARLQADRQQYAQLEQRLAQYEPAMQSIQQQAQEQHLKAQEDALSARHPDWREVIAAPAFAEWLNQQPESLQRLTASDNAADAAALLDFYQAATGSAGTADSRAVTHDTQDKRRERLAAAQSVGRRGAPRQGAVDDDFDAAFDHYAAKKAAR
ncbi:hypothetical protein MHM84_01220 [Halomonas sp. McH1-25]|uniref:hypothetical protein n=1 Tax=unclassified Halomonas TaxID=2609666 RepID=UPI001EF6C2FC|nr:MULTISPECIES: hypothetical protein [unclassified Halomonas]MCG7598402.1 hypothetical protein [Halomonas sp. McH1-25]MCP1342656.1 hypothetical protein [Halomonas sp. FL8]MCP1361717.1 hypothetical protein [Halomonas sp. BBD45]MCP1363813.1 hypothetical protein [Halomonas sp. BBD48]